MHLNRRKFLASAAVSGLTAAAPLGAVEPLKLTKADLPTPALLVDLDAFEANLQRMADHCKKSGCGFRPHAKTHKCPAIAKRQVASGALGVSVATVPEAEAMVAAGIKGVLLTSPIVDRLKITRMVKLIQQGGEVLLSLDHAREVDLLAEAAEAAKIDVDVLIDIDVGSRRTGLLPGEPALELARLIGKRKALHLRGLQAYAGHASHTTGFEKRRQVSQESMAKAVQTRELLSQAGFEMRILSGGSTGTYNIDSAIKGVTELQVGSYIFMDVEYQHIGGQSGAVYTDFRASLMVLSTVVSATHPDRVTIDAGNKSFATCVPFKPAAKGWEGITYGRGGDEFGILTATGGAKLPKLGDRLEFVSPHCDPTVNLYEQIYAVRGEKVEAVWPIAARREGAIKI